MSDYTDIKDALLKTRQCKGCKVYNAEYGGCEECIIDKARESAINQLSTTGGAEE